MWECFLILVVKALVFLYHEDDLLLVEHVDLGEGCDVLIHQDRKLCRVGGVGWVFEGIVHALFIFGEDG